MAVAAESIDLQAEVNVPTAAEEKDAQKPTVKSKWYRRGRSGVWAAVAVTIFCAAGGLILYSLLHQPWNEDTTVSEYIVGGSEATPNSWAYVVTLQYKWWFWWYHDCGGVLIGKRTVLTAAHCFNSDWSVTKRGVYLGEHDMNTVSGREQWRYVIDYKIHPNYNPYNSFRDGHDLALLYLNKDAILNDFVKLAPMPPAGVTLPNNTKCYVAGWGKYIVGDRGPVSPKLKEAPYSVVDRRTCISKDYYGSAKLNKDTICGLGDGERDCICSGDSGGPLTCPWNGTKYVFGVISQGNKYCTRTAFNSHYVEFFAPTLFTSNSKFIAWIRKTEEELKRKWK